MAWCVHINREPTEEASDGNRFRCRILIEKRPTPWTPSPESAIDRSSFLLDLLTGSGALRYANLQFP